MIENISIDETALGIERSKLRKKQEQQIKSIARQLGREALLHIINGTELPSNSGVLNLPALTPINLCERMFFFNPSWVGLLTPMMDNSKPQQHAPFPILPSFHHGAIKKSDPVFYLCGQGYPIKFCGMIKIIPQNAKNCSFVLPLQTRNRF